MTEEPQINKVTISFDAPIEGEEPLDEFVRSLMPLILAELEDRREETRANKNNLEEYWKHGAGAAKIRWGTPSDFTRCRRHLLKHVGPGRAERICSQWHHEMTGLWPGHHGGSDKNGPG